MAACFKQLLCTTTITPLPHPAARLVMSSHASVSLLQSAFTNSEQNQTMTIVCAVLPLAHQILASSALSPPILAAKEIPA